jgi:hypothetical protein
MKVVVARHVAAIAVRNCRAITAPVEVTVAAATLTSAATEHSDPVAAVATRKMYEVSQGSFY